MFVPAEANDFMQLMDLGRTLSMYPAVNSQSIFRAADKPVFGWLLGKRTEAREFMIRANEMGVPVFREIQRAVECMAAVFKRSSYLQRRSDYLTLKQKKQSTPD